MIARTISHQLTLLNVQQNGYNRHLSGPGKTLVQLMSPDLQTVSHLLKDVPNPKKATGVDGVPAWLLKCLSNEISPRRFVTSV